MTCYFFMSPSRASLYSWYIVIFSLLGLWEQCFLKQILQSLFYMKDLGHLIFLVTHSCHFRSGPYYGLAL